MKTIPFFFAALLAGATATSLPARDQIDHARRAEIVREVALRYTEAETYRDRGVVRAVRLKVHDFRSREEGGYDVTQERKIFFETTYRADGDLRVLLATVENGREEFRSFLREADSYRVRSSGVGASSNRSGQGFFTQMSEAFSLDGIQGNELPVILGHPSRHPRPFIVSPTAVIEEVDFNGIPSYQIVGDYRLDFVTLWVDRRNFLIIGSQRVRRQGDEHLVVVTTLYKPERNIVLTDGHFVNIGGDAVAYAPEEWGFPVLHLPELIEKARHAPPAVDANAPPNRVPDQSVERAPASVLEQHLSSEEMGSIVLIEGEKGQGTGFLCRINDVPFVITNLHVLADAKTLRIRNSRGETLRVQAIHGARGHDIALIRVDEMPGGLRIAQDAGVSRIGDPVVVVGNRLGGGVLTQESGQLLGVGPDRVEVDAKFQPGNSGSPIINTRTGEVIGIATYLQEVSIFGSQPAVDSSGRPSREVTTRWFGYRFDSIKEWERIEWAEWQRQQALVQSFRENSDLLLALLRGERNTYMSNAAFRRIVERFERDIGSARISNDDYARRLREFVNDLINFSRSDIRTLDGQFYDYFRSSDYFETSIPLQLEYRQQLREYLEGRERDFRHFRQMLGR